jgi:hypothetical protein
MALNAQGCCRVVYLRSAEESVDSFFDLKIGFEVFEKKD